MTKAKPIIFNGEMVNAILDGRKTMTRRVMKPQPFPLGTQTITKICHDEGGGYYQTWSNDEGSYRPLVDGCPYGIPGEELWVRETWAVNHHYDGLSPKMVSVAMGGDYAHCIDYRSNDKKKDWSGRWRPSIHMPRWASRIQLRITDVRVERVQDISMKEVLDEGVHIPMTKEGKILERVSGKFLPSDYRDVNNYTHEGYIKAQFASLWDSINHGLGYGWDTNCWVWIVEFEVVNG